MANINIDHLAAEIARDLAEYSQDKVTAENKYATNTVFITSIKYKYGGAFKGEYEGRVIA